MVNWRIVDKSNKSVKINYDEKKNVFVYPNNFDWIVNYNHKQL
jgi:hypothetical protein